MSQQNSPNNARRNSNNQGNSSSRKKKKKPKFRLSSVFFIFFIVYIASFFAYMVQANTTNKIPTKDDAILGDSNDDVNSADETTALEDNAIMAINPVAESTPVGEEYLDTCIFIGDSISEGFSGYFFLDDANVIAQQGIRPDNIDEVTIKSQTYGDILAIDGITQSGFKNVYIMLGSNGLGWVSNDKMIEGYREFITEINSKVEGANIYIISVPPVTSKKEDTNEYATVEEGLVLNSTIDELNALYLDLANEMDVHYLDINSYLKDDTGKLPYDSSADGMHFDSATYQKILDYICSHVAQ